jgi:hypothetical protein
MKVQKDKDENFFIHHVFARFTLQLARDKLKRERFFLSMNFFIPHHSTSFTPSRQKRRRWREKERGTFPIHSLLTFDVENLKIHISTCE